jgi:hypothetical protein
VDHVDFGHNNALREGIKQLPPRGTRHVAPAGNDGFQHRTRFQQHLLVAVILLQVG